MPAVLAICAIATSLIAILYVAIQNLDTVLVNLRNRKLWLMVSVMFYTFSVSGMVFCIIRSPPPFSVDRSGRTKFFHPAGRQQFVVEGLIIGSCNVMAAFCVIGLTRVALRQTDEKRRSAMIVAFVVLFFFLYRTVVRSYTMKNGWYSRISWI